MYGFGDDRNPASDTVNVMEEILIEYIIDVVRPALILCSGFPYLNMDDYTVSGCVWRWQEVPSVN